MAGPSTLFDKVWNAHAIKTTEEGDVLLYVDRCFIHEGSRHSFDQIEASGRGVARPAQVFAFADHYAPTSNRHLGLASVNDPEIRGMIELLESNTKRHGIRQFGLTDPQQGILHVVPPELGLTQPGLLIVGADSHTSTHGAFGAIAFGAGASDITHVLGTQTLWQPKPKTMRITIDGELGFGVGAKDIILKVIATIGTGGATGHAIEYAGSGIRSLSMEGRMTVCNMSIEAGARCGMVAPDETTFAYLDGRERAPSGAARDAALAYWRSLPTDEGAAFDAEVSIEGGAIAPMVTWGTSPEHAAFIDDCIPDPDSAPTAEARADIAAALDYIGLEPGQAIEGIEVDRVFIGSCTNGRIEDIRAAAEVASKGRAKVPAWIVPGSQTVKAAAEREGLHEVFQAAGFEWRDPGCSMCTAINGDFLEPHERCASTSNRNFRGRQGRGGRTHLLSPAMAAAAAITGRLTDVRKL